MGVVLLLLQKTTALSWKMTLLIGHFELLKLLNQQGESYCAGSGGWVWYQEWSGLYFPLLRTKEVCVWNAEAPEGVLLWPVIKVDENHNSLI